MLKMDIMKKAEVNFFTIWTLDIQFQSLFAFMFGLTSKEAKKNEMDWGFYTLAVIHWFSMTLSTLPTCVSSKGHLLFHYEHTDGD